MAQIDSHVEEAVTQLRHMLPTNSATAQAIDQHAPWELIALRAVDDGYIECANEFVRFVEACLRRVS
jgi:hypothetical protein